MSVSGEATHHSPSLCWPSSAHVTLALVHASPTVSTYFFKAELNVFDLNLPRLSET